MRNTVIDAKNVTKIYGRGRNRVIALDAVNMEVVEGEFVAIVGPSGSGKTTMLNILGALDRPTRGRVIIDGVDTTVLPERKLFQVRRTKVGFIFQAFHLVPTLTAFENILIPLLHMGVGAAQRERAQQLLEAVGLSGHVDHKPNQLSSGEQQRIAIARSLILEPKLVLADEPTGNLDSQTGAEIIQLMQKLKQRQATTFIVVTHDPRVAESSQQILHLVDGRLST